MTEIQKMTNNVFKINTASGSGSGFYIKKDDLIITNHHVVYGQKKVSIENQQKEKYIAHVVLVNPLNDIAFLKSEKTFDLHDVKFRKHDSVKKMDKVSALGFPLGMPFTITEGIVSSSKQIVDGRVLIQTDAAINPGNSGGPLVNADGEIIGVTSSKMEQAENMGFAIPIDLVLDELENFQLKDINSTAVKCPSCDQILFEKTEYCPNCGVELDVENLFVEETKSELVQFIDDVFKELDIDPVLARTGPDFWQFHQGSAQIRYFIYNTNYLFATSPIVKLPKQNLDKLYDFLLSNPGYPYSYGTYDGKIFISYRVHLTDIKGPHKDEIKNNLILLAKKADEMDNILVDEYGCEFTEDSKV